MFLPFLKRHWDISIITKKKKIRKFRKSPRKMSHGGSCFSDLADQSNIYIYIECIETFLTKNIIQEKLTNFIKILKNINFSCITFRAKIFGYSDCIYCLQEESTHFDLRVSINFGLEASGHFATKIYTRKIDKVFKFLYIVFCPKSFQYLQVVYCRHALGFIWKN